jgi:hypothetical protein
MAIHWQPRRSVWTGTYVYDSPKYPEPVVKPWPGAVRLLVVAGLGAASFYGACLGLLVIFGTVDRLAHNEVTRGDIFGMLLVSLLCSAILFGRALWKWVKG